MASDHIDSLGRATSLPDDFERGLALKDAGKPGARDGMTFDHEQPDCSVVGLAVNRP